MFAASEEHLTDLIAHAKNKQMKAAVARRQHVHTTVQLGGCIHVYVVCSMATLATQDMVKGEGSEKETPPQPEKSPLALNEWEGQAKLYLDWA